MMDKFRIVLDGIVRNNPTFVLVLGMCPTLGTTTSAVNGMGMGLATMAVLILSNVVISLIKNVIPDKVRIPAFIVVIASFVTVIQMLMQAYVPALYEALGVFIPLIVVNCIILGRAEELSYFAIVIGAVFVNNVVLAQFLGICPFLGVSSKVETSLGMGAAVTFVMAIASVVAWLLQTYLLVPFGIEYMQTIVFILVIAALVQMVEIILKKVSPALYQALGIFLPLITTNCAVLGVAILMIQKEFSLLQGVVYAVSSALGFALALVLFAGIRERLDFEEVPAAFRGVPIALVTAGILAMAFMGFSGLV